MEAQLKDLEYNEHIYNYQGKIDREKELLLEKVSKGELSPRNRDFILEFTRDRKLKKGFSNCRILKLMNKLKIIAMAVNKDFDKWDKTDIETFLEHVNKRKDITKTTKIDYIIILKIFFKWLKGNDKVVPEFLADIKATTDRKRRLPSEILNEEDVLKMLNSTSHPRNKAIISVLFDSGLRLSEIINLKMRNLVFDKENESIKINIEFGKTGGRTLLLIPSVPYLIAYLNSLPIEYREDPNCYLFLEINNSVYIKTNITAPSISQMLRRVSKEANIKKKANPHAFRRASAVNCAGFMTDSMLMVRFGWSRRDTVNAYVFMSPNVADEKYKEKFGIKKTEFKDSLLNPIKCTCGQINSPDSICSSCGKPNSLKVAIKTEERRDKEVELLSKIGLMLSKALQNSNPKEAMEISNEIEKLKNTI